MMSGNLQTPLTVRMGRGILVLGLITDKVFIYLILACLTVTGIPVRSVRYRIPSCTDNNRLQLVKDQVVWIVFPRQTELQDNIIISTNNPP